MSGARPGADAEGDRAVAHADELLAGEGVASAPSLEGPAGEAADLLPGVEGDAESFLR